MEIQVNGNSIRFGEGCNFLPIDELVPYKKNPKNHGDKDVNLIVESILRNGFGENLLICPETKEILSGNGRYLAAKKLGLTEVPCVYAPEGLNDKQKADLVIASNKLVEVSGYNNNLEILMGMYELNPEDFGLSAIEKAVQEQEEEEPEVPFTEELLEEHNYVVLYFDNSVDWLQAQSLFGLKTVQALNSKEGFRKMGVGRVLKGSEALERLKKALTEVA